MGTMLPTHPFLIIDGPKTGYGVHGVPGDGPEPSTGREDGLVLLLHKQDLPRGKRPSSSALLVSRYLVSLTLVPTAIAFSTIQRRVDTTGFNGWQTPRKRTIEPPCSRTTSAGFTPFPPRFRNNLFQLTSVA